MGMKILIVDDALFMRNVIRKNLEECGYRETMEAADGKEALELYRKWQPDLVLLDITMPGISGLEVLEQLRRESPEARVIMCSAVGQDQMIANALKLGAFDFIVKPFKKEEFKKIIENAITT